MYLGVDDGRRDCQQGSSDEWGKEKGLLQRTLHITVKGNDYALKCRYEGMGVSFHLFDVC